MKNIIRVWTKYKTSWKVIRRLCHNEPQNGSPFTEWCSRELKTMKRNGVYREPPKTALQNVSPPYVMLANYPRRMLDFSTFDFLHLAYNPHVIMAYNAGMAETSSANTRRIQQGPTRWGLELAELISGHFGTDSCVACANLQDNMRTLWSSNLLKDAIVFYDEYTSFPLPTSLKLVSFRHQNYEELEMKMHVIQNKNKVIVTDITFAETGERVHLVDSELSRVAKSQNSLLFVNATHDWTTKTPDKSDLHPADLIFCDISKQIGQLKGGFIAGKSALVNEIINSNEITDVSGAIASAVAWIIQTFPERQQLVTKLKQNSVALRRKLRHVGFQVKGHNEAIVAIHTPTQRAATELVSGLKNDGILCRRSGPEFANKEDAHVQINVTVKHEPQHLELVVSSATAVGRRYKILT